MPDSRSHSNWHKSSYSSSHGQNCVEVAEGRVTAVRDTQHRHLGHIEFDHEAWAAFVADLKK